MKRCPVLLQPVPDACPRGTCEDCIADLEERAAIVAHHRGLGFPPLTRSQSDELAREQLRASVPGQRSMEV